MKNYTIMSLALAGLLSLNSCGENKKQDEQDGSSMPMHEDAEMQSESLSGNQDDGAETANAEFQDENLAAVYENYLSLKSSLVNSDAEEAKKNGEDLLAVLQETENTNRAVEAARSIAESEDLKAQRTAFSDLSAEVETLLQGQLTSGEVYKQYCPMAFDGQGGYWLSSSEEVRNPYYGEMMLKCGRVADTIK